MTYYLFIIIQPNEKKKRKGLPQERWIDKKYCYKKKKIDR